MSLKHKKFLIADKNLLNCLFPTTDGNPEYWFCVSDVAAFLQYDNSQQALQKNQINEEWQRNWGELEAENCQKDTILISETGLYTLLARSNKPKAVDFINWLYETPEFAAGKKLTSELKKEIASARSEVELAREREENARDAAMLADCTAKSLRRDKQALEEACLRFQKLLNEWKWRVVPPLDNQDKHEHLVLFQHSKQPSLVAVTRIQVVSLNKKKKEMQKEGYKVYREWKEAPSAQKLWLATLQRLGPCKDFGLSHETSMRFQLLDEEEIEKKYENYLCQYENRHNNQHARKSPGAKELKCIVEVVKELQNQEGEDKELCEDGIVSKCDIRSVEELAGYIDEVYNKPEAELAEATRGEDVNLVEPTDSDSDDDVKKNNLVRGLEKFKL